MYRIDPSVYECADSALLELIEKAKVSALTDDELVRYEAGLKALEDAVDFEELLSDSVKEAKAESFAEGHAEGHAEGVAEGRAEGKTQNQIETAKRMLSMKMDVEMIAHISGLSVEEKILRMVKNDAMNSDTECAIMELPQMSRRSERSAS